MRLGVGDRSYLVRDKQIEVLKNVYGGVQVIIVISAESLHLLVSCCHAGKCKTCMTTADQSCHLSHHLHSMKAAVLANCMQLM